MHNYNILLPVHQPDVEFTISQAEVGSSESILYFSAIPESYKI